MRKRKPRRQWAQRLAPQTALFHAKGNASERVSPTRRPVRIYREAGEDAGVGFFAKPELLPISLTAFEGGAISVIMPGALWQPSTRNDLNILGFTIIMPLG